jgi:hypothetical protein
MSYIHFVVDIVRMWLTVKVYKNAFRETPIRSNSTFYIFYLLLFTAKYKFAGIISNFNDCFMVVVVLFAILAY